MANVFPKSRSEGTTRFYAFARLVNVCQVGDSWSSCRLLRSLGGGVLAGRSVCRDSGLAQIVVGRSRGASSSRSTMWLLAAHLARRSPLCGRRSECRVFCDTFCSVSVASLKSCFSGGHLDMFLHLNSRTPVIWEDFPSLGCFGKVLVTSQRTEPFAAWRGVVREAVSTCSVRAGFR